MTTPSDVKEALAGLRILVAEDVFVLAEQIERFLIRLDCEVVGPVRTLDKALELARTTSLDGAVLDVDLEGQAVFPVADELKRRGIPFIFTTGYDTASLPEEHRTGPHLEKPFGPQDLARALKIACIDNGQNARKQDEANP